MSPIGGVTEKTEPEGAGSLITVSLGSTKGWTGRYRGCGVGVDTEEGGASLVGSILGRNGVAHGFRGMHGILTEDKQLTTDD